MRLPFIGQRRWPPLWSVIERSFPFQVCFYGMALSAALTTGGDALGWVPLLGPLLVFYWRLYLPHLLPIWTIFVLGLAQDVMLGDVLGYGFLTFLPLFLFTATSASRYFRAHFWLAWIIACLALAACGGLAYLLSSGLAWQLLDPMPALQRYGMTLPLFPVVVILFAWFEFRLAGAGAVAPSPLAAAKLGGKHGSNGRQR